MDLHLDGCLNMIINQSFKVAADSSYSIHTIPPLMNKQLLFCFVWFFVVSL